MGVRFAVERRRLALAVSAALVVFVPVGVSSRAVLHDVLRDYPNPRRGEESQDGDGERGDVFRDDGERGGNHQTQRGPRAEKKRDAPRLGAEEHLRESPQGSLRAAVRPRGHQQRHEEVQAVEEREHDARRDDGAEFVEDSDLAPEHGNHRRERRRPRRDDGRSDARHRVLPALGAPPERTLAVRLGEVQREIARQSDEDGDGDRLDDSERPPRDGEDAEYGGDDGDERDEREDGDGDVPGEHHDGPDRERGGYADGESHALHRGVFGRHANEHVPREPRARHRRLVPLAALVESVVERRQKRGPLGVRLRHLARGTVPRRRGFDQHPRVRQAQFRRVAVARDGEPDDVAVVLVGVGEIGHDAKKRRLGRERERSVQRRSRLAPIAKRGEETQLHVQHQRRLVSQRVAERRGGDLKIDVGRVERFVVHSLARLRVRIHRLLRRPRHRREAPHDLHSLEVCAVGAFEGRRGRA